jgi:uncharacterized repeat protein (TIGR03803 family)
MKTRITDLSLLRVLIATLGLILASRLMAQNFTTLHNFSEGSGSPATNSDGATPYAGLVLSGNIVYGTTFQAGMANNGTVFAVKTDGTDFTNLHSFTALSAGGTNGDGAHPYASLVLSGNALYGTTQFGGRFDAGTLFKINIDGAGFTNLHDFTGGSGGAMPSGALVSSGNNLYGTTVGGTSGTVFKVSIDGTRFTNLHTFKASSPMHQSNSDGIGPQSLILVSNILYGTAVQGGTAGDGTVFRINTDGTGFTTLHGFAFNEGVGPSGALVLSGNTLYGTAHQGGSSFSGTIFAVNTDGTGFTNIYSFTARSAAYPQTNSDGANPSGGLILSGKTLYGSTQLGGSGGSGTLFKVNTDGMEFAALHSFMPVFDPSYTNDGGAYPSGSLILSDNVLYGTAANGGTYWGILGAGGGSGFGTVFGVSLTSVSPLQVTLIPSGGPYLILTWPTNFTGFAVQSTTNLVSPNWTTNLPVPVVVNGRNTVTNPISDTQQFFRLNQ